ncbi:MAG: hypothetical protein HY078_10950 [Elusimicrobia bacterium]|nr:hypothetical protein [Elusimicrobiota bacterium]
MRGWIVAVACAVPAAAAEWFPQSVEAHRLAAAATPPSLAAAPARSSGPLALKGFVSAWTQACVPACAVPVPVRKNEAVEASLALPEASGRFRKVHFERTVDIPGASSPLKVSVTMFAVCPAGGAGISRGCPNPYVQTQIELSGAVGGFCGAAQSLSDAAPFPVLMCAGADPSGRRVGVTLHRRAL